MDKALQRMSAISTLHANRYKITPRVFGWVRAAAAKAQSAFRKGKYVGTENFNYGNKWTEEQRNKMRGHKRNVGRKHTDEQKKKWSELKLSMNIKWSDEQKLAKGKAMRDKMPEIVCEHCNKAVKGLGNYHRWHGAKCKLNSK